MSQTLPQSARKFPWGMLVVALLFVIIPFLWWYGVWFGRPLSDDKIEIYLRDTEKPRNVQHAIEQIVKRLEEGDKSVQRWYPAIASLKDHPTPEVRSVAAWAMGQDTSYTDFKTSLWAMLDDAHPTVRHNAALALVRFGDGSGRPELIAMLTPRTIRADADGRVSYLLKEGAAFAAGSPIARIEQNNGEPVEMRAPEAGHVERILAFEGAEVSRNDELVVLGPDTEQVWEALRALYFVGQPQDIPVIQRYTLELPGMPERIRKQAGLTSEAIRARGSASSSLTAAKRKCGQAG